MKQILNSYVIADESTFVECSASIGSIVSFEFDPQACDAVTFITFVDYSESEPSTERIDSESEARKKAIAAINRLIEIFKNSKRALMRIEFEDGHIFESLADFFEETKKHEELQAFPPSHEYTDHSGSHVVFTKGLES